MPDTRPTGALLQTRGREGTEKGRISRDGKKREKREEKGKGGSEKKRREEEEEREGREQEWKGTEERLWPLDTSALRPSVCFANQARCRC